MRKKNIDHLLEAEKLWSEAAFLEKQFLSIKKRMQRIKIKDGSFDE